MFCAAAGASCENRIFWELVRGQLQFVNCTQFGEVEKQSRTIVVGKVSISLLERSIQRCMLGTFHGRKQKPGPQVFQPNILNLGCDPHKHISSICNLNIKGIIQPSHLSRWQTARGVSMMEKQHKRRRDLAGEMTLWFAKLWPAFQHLQRLKYINSHCGLHQIYIVPTLF